MIGSTGSESSKACSDFGKDYKSQEICTYIKKEIGDMTMEDAYYLTSSLSYEIERCELHGKSILHYVIFILKKILKKLLRLLIRLLIRIVIQCIQLLVMPPACFFFWALIFLGIFIYGTIIPKIKKILE